MKKNLYALSILILSAVLIFAATACGEDKNEEAAGNSAKVEEKQNKEAVKEDKDIEVKVDETSEESSKDDDSDYLIDDDADSKEKDESKDDAESKTDENSGAEGDQETPDADKSEITAEDGDLSLLNLSEDELEAALIKGFWLSGDRDLSDLPFAVDENIKAVIEEHHNVAEAFGFEIEEKEFAVDDINVKKYSDGSIALYCVVSDKMKYKDMPGETESKAAYFMLFEAEGDDEIKLINFYSIEPIYMQLLKRDVVEKVESAGPEDRIMSFDETYEMKEIKPVEDK